MKILLISDLHYVNYKRWISFLENFKDGGQRNQDYDLLITLGDLDHIFLSQIENNIKEKKKIGVLGNHDYYDDLSFFNIEDMNKNTKDIEDEKFIGLHGSVRYKKGDFACYTQEESVKALDTDYKATILISHASPNGMHDRKDEAHIGLIGINKYMDKHEPKYIIHGHVHTNQVSFYKETTIISVYGGILLDTKTGLIEHVLKIDA